MKVVRDYMYLQQMRFGDRIRYEEEIAGDVDPDRVSVPALIIQPLVENAVIHGLSHSVEGGKVCIFISRTEGAHGDLIVIRIEDTGEGMDEETLLRVRAEIEAGGHPATAQSESDSRNERRVGIGLGNVAWRICDVYKDGNMTIESRKGEGTVVTLFIPEVSDE